MDARWGVVCGGGTPKQTDMRHLFYEIRTAYLIERPHLSKIDSLSKTLYQNWEEAVKQWCVDYAEDFGFNGTEWWRAREGLNIYPDGRALCEGEGGSYLVDSETRDKVATGCSFILLCEKKTISKELTEALRGEGYHLNIVSTGGFSSADVQEAVVTISESLDNEEPTFYFLSLHDYDLAGVGILRNLKERYEGVIDIGVNGEFLGFLKERGQFDSRLLEEQCENRKFLGALRDWIADGDGHDYISEDFEYLQGEQVSKKRWIGHRIELDSIHVVNGIKPFVNYVMYKIQKECKVWDLSRIGVEEFELEEPPNHYHRLIGDLEDRVGRAYGKKLTQLSESLNTVIDIAKETLTQPPEFEELEEKYRGSKGSGYVVSETGYSYTYNRADVKGVDPIKEKFGEQVKRDWAEDYEDELEEVNQQITVYEGDVREGEEDLKGQSEELQERLETDKENDPDLDKFSEELDEVKWGKEELEAIEVPDEADEIRKVIEALQKKLEEIGGNRAV